ncbi:MAG TPA: nuclear transport factor 2 family protein [Paracoccaceae bacterium]|nr:nuclear transport factor 2 family protein [Paracoccaceae bacterium]
MTTAPEDWARAFATAWGAADAAALTALMTPEAAMLGLTGGWAEGRGAVLKMLAAERAGVMARARLVTGRARLRPLVGVTVLHQRFVLSGLVDATGQEMPRMTVHLTAVLVPGDAGWQADSLTFAAAEG